MGVGALTEAERTALEAAELRGEGRRAVSGTHRPARKPGLGGLVLPLLGWLSRPRRPAVPDRPRGRPTPEWAAEYACCPARHDERRVPGRLLSPNGTFGNLASTQYGNLPLLRLLSVTGLWGIVFARAYAPLNDDLLAHSEQEARAGAKIIVWPEGGAQVPQEDEAALLGRAGTLARTTGVRTRHLPYVRL